MQTLPLDVLGHNQPRASTLNAVLTKVRRFADRMRKTVEGEDSQNPSSSFDSWKYT